MCSVFPHTRLLDTESDAKTNFASLTQPKPVVQQLIKLAQSKRSQLLCVFMTAIFSCLYDCGI